MEITASSYVFNSIVSVGGTEQRCLPLTDNTMETAQILKVFSGYLYGDFPELPWFEESDKLIPMQHTLDLMDKYDCPILLEAALLDFRKFAKPGNRIIPFSVWCAGARTKRYLSDGFGERSVCRSDNRTGSVFHGKFMG